MANNASIGIGFRGKKQFLAISHQYHLHPPLHDQRVVNGAKTNLSVAKLKPFWGGL